MIRLTTIGGVVTTYRGVMQSMTGAEVFSVEIRVHRNADNATHEAARAARRDAVRVFTEHAIGVVVDLSPAELAEIRTEVAEGTAPPAAVFPSSAVRIDEAVTG